MVFSTTDSSFKIFSITNSTFSFIQNISIVFSEYHDKIKMKGDYLMVTTRTDIALYRFDIFSLQYNINFTKNYTAVDSVQNNLLGNG